MTRAFHRKPWTVADDAELERLYAEHSAAEVAAKMERTKAAIGSRVQLQGLRKTAKQRTEIYRRSTQRVPRGFMVRQQEARQ